MSWHTDDIYIHTYNNTHVHKNKAKPSVCLYTAASLLKQTIAIKLGYFDIKRKHYSMTAF